MTLNYGQRNVIVCALGELAGQIEELHWLVRKPIDCHAILPVKNIPVGPEMNSMLAKLAVLSALVREMCVNFEIELETIDVRRNIHGITEYLKATITNVRPEHLGGHGKMYAGDRHMLDSHIAKFLSNLKELQRLL